MENGSKLSHSEPKEDAFFRKLICVMHLVVRKGFSRASPMFLYNITLL